MPKYDQYETDKLEYLDVPLKASMVQKVDKTPMPIYIKDLNTGETVEHIVAEVHGDDPGMIASKVSEQLRKTMGVDTNPTGRIGSAAPGCKIPIYTFTATTPTPTRKDSALTPRKPGEWLSENVWAYKCCNGRTYDFNKAEVAGAFCELCHTLHEPPKEPYTNPLLAESFFPPPKPPKEPYNFIDEMCKSLKAALDESNKNIHSISRAAAPTWADYRVIDTFPIGRIFPNDRLHSSVDPHAPNPLTGTPPAGEPYTWMPMSDRMAKSIEKHEAKTTVPWEDAKRMILGDGIATAFEEFVDANINEIYRRAEVLCWTEPKPPEKALRVAGIMWDQDEFADERKRCEDKAKRMASRR